MPKSRSAAVELPELMTVEQVCEYLSMDDSTLRRHRRTGLFPAPDVVISGRFPRWKKRTVAAYLTTLPTRLVSCVTTRRAQSITRERYRHKWQRLEH